MKLRTELLTMNHARSIRPRIVSLDSEAIAAGANHDCVALRAGDPVLAIALFKLDCWLGGVPTPAVCGAIVAALAAVSQAALRRLALYD